MVRWSAVNSARIDAEQAAATKRLASLHKTPSAVLGPAVVSADVLPLDADSPVTVNANPGFSEYRTRLDFSNSYGSAVRIYEIDVQGAPQLRTTLAPGRTYKANTQFGIPWLAADTNGHPLGLYFPTASPANAEVPDARTLSWRASLGPEDVSRYYEGYLTPIRPAAAAAPVGAGQGIRTAIGFVNWTTQTIDLYCATADGARSKVTSLGPGKNYSAKTYLNDRWIASDPNSDFVETYKPAPIPMTAILWPR